MIDHLQRELNFHDVDAGETFDVGATSKVSFLIGLDHR
jgi:hypothetical protein